MEIFMKIFKKLLIPIALITAFFGSSQAMEIYNKYFYAEYEKRTPDEELIKKYPATPAYMAYVNKEIDKSGLRFTSKAPYLFKYNRAMSRLRGSLLIRECAQEFDLDAVSTPEKLLRVNDDGTIQIVGGEEVVVVRGIKSHSVPFCLKQIQQLCKMIKKTGFADIKDANIFNTQEGIAYVIDTEIRSFYVPGNFACCTKYDLVTFYERMKKLLTMEDKAKEWLEQKIEKQKSKKMR